MKVAIIAVNNLRLSPYTFYYTNILDQLGIEYEVIVPNRNAHLIDDYSFKLKVLDWNDCKCTLWNYISYTKQVRDYVKENFDFLIVLTTINAVFASSWLKKYFKNKYIVDIRDYTHENNRVYFAMEKKAISNATLCIISSEKYKSFLPKGKYLVCHNISLPDNAVSYKFQKSAGKLIIGYVGAIAYAQQCKQMMELVKNDHRFEFHFYGTGVAEQELKDYAKDLNCERIKFFGAYKSTDKSNIIQKVDMLFNVYGFGYPLVDFALSNKLYDAFWHHKLLLTSPHTYMTEIGGAIAYAVNYDNEKSLDGLWEWYQNLDCEAVDEFSTDMINKLINENNETKNAIAEVIAKIKCDK